MALSQSALSDLLDALRSGDGVDLIRESVRIVMQELIETEAAERIGAARYERSTSRVTERNGYRSRLVSTQAGDVQLRIPKLRKGSFISEALKQFCADRVGICYIPPGQPWKNGYAESFNNRVRDECLNLNQFDNLLEAQITITDWKDEYNRRHRHSSLGYLTPREYADRCQHIHQLSNQVDH